jgi:hypothetical protein
MADFKSHLPRISAARELYVIDEGLRAAIHLEDDAHTSGDSGAFVLGVRNDVRGSLVSADGDYSSFQVNASGDVRTRDDDANTTLTSIETSVQLIDDMIFAEDSAHTTGAAGAHVLAVRQDTLASSVDADGDYASLKVDSLGRLYTKADVALDISKAEDSVHVSGDEGIFMLAVRNDNGTTLTDADGDYSAIAVDKTGAVKVTVVDPTLATSEVRDHNTTVDLAVGPIPANHDYTVTAATTLKAGKMFASASGRIKASLIIDPAGTNETVLVAFNSTAAPLIDIDLKGFVEVAAGTVVRIAIENLDEDAQNVYSTLFGNEV